MGEDRSSKIDRFKIAWQHFINVGEIMPGIRPVIARSWLKCKKYGLNPYLNFKNSLPNLEKEAIEDPKPQLKMLISILQECLGWFNFELLLMLIQAQKIVAVLGQLEGPFLALIRPGQLIAEEIFGTFAPVLALEAQEDFEVAGYEHFMSCFHDFHSLAVHFSINDEAWLLGVLLPLEQSGPQTMGLLKAVTEVINLKLQLLQAQLKELEVVPLAELEKREIMKALEVSEGDIDQSALLLEISRSALASKIRKYGLLP